jgi:short-subunit dehydrogenase
LYIRNSMNKKILVVGGTSGLGRKLAEIYASEGCQVGIIGRREDLLAEIKKQFPAIEVVKADISKDDIPEQLMNLIGKMDGMDILLLTASIGEFNEDLVAEKELRTTAINVKGYIQVLHTAWHYFKKKGGGQIAAVTSIAAARGNKVAPAYNASKAFQSSYLEGLRIKAKHEKNNITVTELVPGYMQTDMGKGERMFWVAPLDKAARQSIRGIDRKRKRIFITKRWWWIYGILKFLPIRIYDPLINGSWKLKRKT